MIKQANTVLQREMEFEKAMDQAHFIKDEILNQQEEIKNSRSVEQMQARQVDIPQKVKDVIRKSLKLQYNQQKKRRPSRIDF